MKFPKVKVGIKKEEQYVRPADPIPLPEPQAPKVSGIYDGTVISQAKNPQWVYVKIQGLEGKHPVIIPRRLSGKLDGKQIKVEAITDVTGTSYRYVTPS